MNNKVNEKKLKTELLEMMDNMSKVDPIYKPGNYWQFYERKIIKQILGNRLDQFRSWEGGAGTGSIHSFGGGEMELQRSFNYYFHPFEKQFKKIDNNFFIKIYNSLINKISRYLNFFTYFAFRSSLARKIFFDKIKSEFETKYDLIKLIDPKLLTAKDSRLGEPIGFEKDKKFYTNYFLNILIEYHHIKKNLKKNDIKNVVEVGAGTGMLANIFLQLNKKSKYFILDIPPTLFIAEYNLRNLGYSVYGFKELKAGKKDFKKYDVILLPTWKLDFLNNVKFDLFINIASFQEMEKQQSLLYLNFFKKHTKYIYLKNAINGHFVAKKKNQLGVISPTKMTDCEKCLKKTHITTYKEIYNYNKNYRLLLKKYN